MTTNIEHAAEVIDRWTQDGSELNSAVGSTYEIATLLADAGLLIPDLPEPSCRNHRGEPIWETEGGTKVRTPGMLPVSLSGPFGEGWDMHPVEARDIAYALLAAAKLAEGQK